MTKVGPVMRLYSSVFFNVNCFICGVSVLFVFLNKGLNFSEIAFVVVDLIMSISLSFVSLSLVAIFFYCAGCIGEPNYMRKVKTSKSMSFQSVGFGLMLMIIGVGIILIIPNTFGETYTSITQGVLFISFGLLTLSVSIFSFTKGQRDERT
tara:strand:- start:4222 stop:4674 length:453 start_codon:yes stop_codon:yes gene_type:complete